MDESDYRYDPVYQAFLLTKAAIQRRNRLDPDGMMDLVMGEFNSMSGAVSLQRVFERHGGARGTDHLMQAAAQCKRKTFTALMDLYEFWGHQDERAVVTLGNKNVCFSGGLCERLELLGRHDLLQSIRNRYYHMLRNCEHLKALPYELIDVMRTYL